ncbi:interferon-induced GTP-binding protein Mx3 [Ctenopharyngodon idella]|uniref:interferon-induced GTP-binding protein Mx3 n=1 Tax=Ctenopharyngodon idella TaxID=7959 RepID=UPI00222EC479|nr:interferon-induced GTP-binding protein Mx3 [Ctenopharyngodon idella]XP_051739308.1 interferon-induced GTP-binding protein Mx3 [Ctenopharyngodon idella]
MDSSPEILDFDSSDENGPENSGIFLQQWDAQVRPYIEMIDFMRRIGIERELALPSIAVVGDQSSGKSSVLEALSGVALPRGSGIVTRCPLELKLRKLNSGSGWTAIISYNDVRETFHDPAQVESYVRRAQNMLAGDGVGICDDLISLEITSPDVCDLTLIDLPGITRVPVKGQPEDIGDQIRRLILKFIAKKETINLVVVPCNVDVATTEALRMAQGVDPDGSRTLAILTKPDLIDKGAEADVLQVLQGKVVPLKKGYTIVRCRGQSDINENVSLAEATRQEKEFFANHTHFGYLLEEQRATTSCLATRLTKELVEHIKASLPSLRDQIHIHLSEVRFELKSYDDGPPLEPERMGPYLSKKILEFSDQISELCRTGESDNGNLYSLLRPVFKQWECHLSNSKASFRESVKEMTEKYDEAHRGRELVTFSDYCVYESMVKKHVGNLKRPALDTLKLIRGIVQKEFRAMCELCFPNYPHLRHIILTHIDDIHSKQEGKVEKRIYEYINMEKLVYTQDPIFTQKIVDFKFVEKRQEYESISLDTGENATSPNNCAVFDTRSLTPEKLIIYYEIVYQRLADYIPMVILLFILKEAAVMLRAHAMDLRDGADVVKLLVEDTEAGRKRADLHQRMERLRLAQERISIYL